jgi:hypothetical protein
VTPKSDISIATGLDLTKGLWYDGRVVLGENMTKPMPTYETLREIWEHIEEYRELPFFVYHPLVSLKPKLGELDKNALKAWNVIETDESKLKEFFGIAATYWESTKVTQSNGELIWSKQLRKPDEHSSVATITTGHQRSKPIHTSNAILRNIEHLISKIRNFQDFLIKSNEEMAYIFKMFDDNKIEMFSDLEEMELLQLYFDATIYNTFLYKPPQRIIELSDLCYELDKLKATLKSEPDLMSDFKLSLATELNHIVDADKHMITCLYNLIQNKGSAMKISIKVYEWATGKRCPDGDDGQWSLANMVIRNIKQSQKS